MKFPSPTQVWHNALYNSIDPTRPGLSAKGKSVFITGGGAGIGVAIVHAFAKAGATKIAITGRRESKLLATKTDVEKAFDGVTITTFVGDITDQKAMDNAFATIGTVDIVVNNAGYLSDLASIKDSALDEWWRGFEVNVKGSFIVAQAFLKVASANATIVNVTAGMAHLQEPVPGFSSYAASKLASAKFFQLLQEENPELCIISVHPGIVQSEMVEKATIMEAQDDGKPWCRMRAGNMLTESFS